MPVAVVIESELAIDLIRKFALLAWIRLQVVNIVILLRTMYCIWLVLPRFYLKNLPRYDSACVLLFM